MQPECSQKVAKKLQNVANMSAKCSHIVANMWSECTKNIARMNGSLTLLDDNLLYIAFSIIGISSKNEQEMKFRGRGEGHCPIRSFYRIILNNLTICCLAVELTRETASFVTKWLHYPHYFLSPHTQTTTMCLMF